MTVEVRDRFPVRNMRSEIQRVGQAAALALRDELALTPKPGLVSFFDSGSHQDMNALTFLQSICAVQPYFHRMVALGYDASNFDLLRHEGVSAEASMLQATRGINTHRGAIFSLGLLCAAAGAVLAAGQKISPAVLQQTLIGLWGRDLTDHAERTRDSAGSRLARAYGIQSAAGEAALGFPVLFNAVYPALTQSLEMGWSKHGALLSALVRAMSVLDDTNLVHRGGMEGLKYVRLSAQEILSKNVTEASLIDAAWKLHVELTARRLSPGGCADMLACSAWLGRVSDW